jgi:hypothetical protein
MTEELEFAYLAGIIDGEGTISVCMVHRPDGVNALHKMLGVFNTNYTLIAWLKERFGGVVHSRTRSDKWKQEHQLKWSAEEASELLAKVLPYLVIKKEQAEIFIQLHKTKGVTKVSAEVQELREKLVNRCQELNKRGPKIG